jgi:aminopeptidase
MSSPLLERWAQVLVDYSVELQPKQLVRIVADPVGIDLAEAIFEAVVRRGAHPHVRLVPKSWDALFLEHASEEQIRWTSPLMLHEVETIDASISLWGEANTRCMMGVDPQRQAWAGAARRPIFDRFLQRAAAGSLKWVGTQVICEASAQDADMSLRDYERFLVAAGRLDHADPVGFWRGLGQRQQKLADHLETCSELVFWTPQGTELTVNISGMHWMNSCGLRNFPDGEVFTGPNLKAQDGGANGWVHVTFPGVHLGHLVEGVRLRFERGAVVEAEADRGRDFLLAALETDAGARRMGEIAIGTNFGIERFTRNTLFDEKMGGTFHFALGAGYPQTRNTNVSGLHWDLVTDLRCGGWIKADGQIILQDGRFVGPFADLNP